LTPAMFTVFTVLTLWASVRYSLLDYSPRHQWDKIVNTMNDGLLILNLKNEIMFANQKFISMSGYSLLELTGLKPQNIFETGSEKLFENPKEGQNEILLVTGKGQKLWTIVRASPYLDEKDRVLGNTLICTDINASKRSEARFRALVEHAGDIISLTDISARFRFTSPAMEKVLGYTQSELLQKSFFQLVHSDSLEKFKETFEYLVKNPEQLISGEFGFIHKDGHDVWLEGKMVNMLTDGNVHAIVSNLRDITERKYNEAQLRNLLSVSE